MTDTEPLSEPEPGVTVIHGVVFWTFHPDMHTTDTVRDSVESAPNDSSSPFGSNSKAFCETTTSLTRAGLRSLTIWRVALRAEVAVLFSTRTDTDPSPEPEPGVTVIHDGTFRTLHPDMHTTGTVCTAVESASNESSLLVESNSKAFCETVTGFFRPGLSELTTFSVAVLGFVSRFCVGVMEIRPLPEPEVGVTVSHEGAS